MIWHYIIFMLSVSTISGTKSTFPNGRIIGGSDTTIEENPWQVALIVTELIKCGGSLIAPDVVVTAAHCSIFAPSSYSILSGTNDVNSDSSTLSQVKQIIRHEKYNSSGYINDIALLILKEPLDFDNTTRAIPLTDIEPHAGDLVRVTGWGVTNLTTYNSSAILQSVDIKVIGRDKCQEEYDKCSFCPRIDETMICAGTPDGGKGHCYDDYGGPISKNGVLVGLVSWAKGCAEPGFPGVNTNIAAVREWIREKVGV